jgi:epoxide hydrolase 4
MHLFDLPLPHGITLACREARPASAATSQTQRVLLLHGFPEAAFVWDEVLQHLAQLAPQARCVAPNLRGYIGSSSPPEVQAYRAKHLVADVVAAIETLGGPLDLLVAHDWGGALAWNLVAQQPQLVKHLLIINSPHPATFLRELRSNPAQQAASVYMNFLCRPDAAALLAENNFARLWPFLASEPVAGTLEVPAWLTPEVRAQFVQAWSHPGGGLQGPLNYYAASPLRPPTGPSDALHTLVLPDEAVTINVPTTVLWGEQDRALLPALLTGLERWVPQLTVQRWPEASHWVVHEQPERVAGLVAGLLG